MRFPIAFSRVNRPVLTVLGLGPGRAYVDIGEGGRGGEVAVRMGYGFRAAIPRSSITGAAAVAQIPWGWGVGVHGFGGRWVVNGTLRNLVRLDIAPPARGRVLGVPVKLSSLWVSVEDPQAVVAALGR